LSASRPLFFTDNSYVQFNRLTNNSISRGGHEQGPKGATVMFLVKWRWSRINVMSSFLSSECSTLFTDFRYSVSSLTCSLQCIKQLGHAMTRNQSWPAGQALGLLPRESPVRIPRVNIFEGCVR